MARKQEVFGVTVEGDISGLKSTMNEAVKVFNSTERSIKNINKALKLDPGNLDLIAKNKTYIQRLLMTAKRL